MAITFGDPMEPYIDSYDHVRERMRQAQMDRIIEVEADKRARRIADERVRMIMGGPNLVLSGPNEMPTLSTSPTEVFRKKDQEIKDLKEKLENKGTEEKQSLESIIAYYYNR